MTTHIKALLASMLVLAACSGNPFVTDGTDPGTDPGGPITVDTPVTVPAAVKVNMNSAKLADYTTGADSITLNLTSQDATALEATYLRAPQFDVTGYDAYSYQETSSNRYVVALVREVGSAKAVIAVDAGQFANYHGGGSFTRADVFTMPTAGVGEPFTYSGTYVGLLNIGERVPGPGGDLDPERAFRTEGRALITADFTEMSISGGVDGRRIVDGDPLGNGGALGTIALFETGINANGTFAGRVYVGTDEEFIDAGAYAGLFAGTNATEIATLMVFNPVPSDNLLFEHGMVVLPSCASGGGPGCP